MAKTLNGGALISYGTSLPATSVTPDGALYYKTGSADGQSQGLYMFGFVKDSDSSNFGYQSNQSWQQVVSPDLFVVKTGDTMTGSLTVPSYVRITSASGPQRLLIGNQDAGGLNKPAIINSQNGVVTIGTGGTWSGDGGTLTSALSINAAQPASGLQWFGAQVWTAQNDGAGSTLDADLLDGQQGSYYLNATNLNAGTTAVTFGGTGNTIVAPIGSVVYGQTSTKLGYTSVGTATHLLQSAGAGTPTWVDPATISVAFATNAGSASTATTANNALTANSATTATTANTAILANKASTLSQAGGNGAAMTFTYTPQAGQPTSLWGTNDGVNMFPYNPANFASGTATSATTALKWTNARTITLGEDLSGSVSIDGTANVTLNATVLNDSHLHTNYVIKSGDTMTGQLLAPSFSTTTAQSVGLFGGSAGVTGHVAFYQGTTRHGYIGAASASAMMYVSEVGGNHNFSGNTTATGNVTAYSDVRVKKNIEMITGALAKVQALRGVTFDRTDIDAPRQTGLIAQDLREVLPEAVMTDGVTDILSVAYGNVVGLLVEAIKEQQKQIVEMADEVARMKRRIANRT